MTIRRLAHYAREIAIDLTAGAFLALVIRRDVQTGMRPWGASVGMTSVAVWVFAWCIYCDVSAWRSSWPQPRNGAGAD